MTKTYTVHTDNNGYYHSTQNFSPPGPFGFSVDLYATITAPAGAHVACTVTLNNSSGAQNKSFTADTGERIALGSWHITSGTDILVISGQTNPVLANADVTIDVEANLAGF
jgi:hypothetical protein